MDFSTLPQEIFEHIASYLSVSDLLTCSLVNTIWRNNVNSNKIWYDHCFKKAGLKFDKFYFIQEPNYVFPSFKFPPEECKSLLSICDWRKRFMQEAHLTRNWKNGNYRTYLIFDSDTALERQLCQNIVFNRDVILIADDIKKKITVYSIKQKPYIIQEIPFSLQHVSYCFFKLVDNKLIFLQCNLLQIFVQKDDFFYLSQRVLFNKPHSDSEIIPSSENLTMWYENIIRLYPSDIRVTCDQDGEYFVGSLIEDNSSKVFFHVWSLKKAEKLTCEALPDHNCFISDLTLTIHNFNVYIIINHHSFSSQKPSKQCSFIYSFDLKTLRFTNLKLKFVSSPSILLFGNNFILSTDINDKEMYLWKNDSGSCVHKISFNYLYPMTLQFFGSYIIYAEKDMEHTTGLVKVFDTKNLNTFKEFRTSGLISYLLPVRCTLLIVGLTLKGAELWDISSLTKLFTLSNWNCLGPTSDCSKLIVDDFDGIVGILHFW